MTNRDDWFRISLDALVWVCAILAAVVVWKCLDAGVARADEPCEANASGERVQWTNGVMGFCVPQSGPGNPKPIGAVIRIDGNEVQVPAREGINLPEHGFCGPADSTIIIVYYPGGERGTSIDLPADFDGEHCAPPPFVPPTPIHISEE